MPPAAGVIYRAFVDPSGGSEDAMTLAIAHKTTAPDKRVIADAVREARPPFSPEAVVDVFAALCKLYRITKITGDHFGGEFVKEPFRRHGLSYEIAKQPKSNLYRDLLPLLNSGRIMLPKHDRLVSQIVGLERRVSRSGKDSIDHAPHGHDDLANAVAGVADATRLPYYDPFMGCGSEYEQHPPDAGLETGRLWVERGGRDVQSARSRAIWPVRFISVGWLFWVSLSTSRPLHLTDTQLASVRRAAALLRPGERSQFLQAIAYELADIEPIDDEAVKEAVEAIMDAAARR